jgi:hypothetical protein
MPMHAWGGVTTTQLHYYHKYLRLQSPMDHLNIECHRTVLDNQLDLIGSCLACRFCQWVDHAAAQSKGMAEI